MRTELACACCGSALPKRRRRYCATCSPLATKLWCKEMRRRLRGTDYYFDWWVKAAGGDEILARQNRADYMRAYRARRRAASQSSYTDASLPGMIPGPRT
jgi:hypothetical protein